jgi:hypothetical protein
MRVARPVQREIGRAHGAAEPGAFLPVGAAGEHALEGGVDAHFITLVAHVLGERARHLELIAMQHHARVGRPPEDRLGRGVPGKDAAAVGFEQARDGEIAARREQAVRVPHRPLHRREGIGALNPR